MTTNNVEQAMERSGLKDANKGYEGGFDSGLDGQCYSSACRVIFLPGGTVFGEQSSIRTLA